MELERIASFTVDHTRLLPGMYLSRRDGSVATIDLRFRRPNTGDLLSNAALHSIEHIAATLLRSGPEKDSVVYFGPMGCQTGFYLLYDSNQLSDGDAVELVKETFAAGAAFEGDMPGKSPIECGNYINLEVSLAREQCAYYSGIIRDWTAEKLAY